MLSVLLVPVAVLSFLLGKKLGKKEVKSEAPLVGVPLVAWERFVAVMAVHPRDHVDERYRLGTFGMDARKLKDVGAMSTASKGVYRGKSGVWMGTWTRPLTESAFLGSMPLQYAAFVRSMRTAAPRVDKHVGVVVSGEVASLSGLLGVAHAAGEAGVDGWVTDPEVRRRFSKTTETFGRTNQIF